ncbi:unnamed protein product [Ixodes persulcatus]
MHREWQHTTSQKPVRHIVGCRHPGSRSGKFRQNVRANAGAAVVPAAPLPRRVKPSGKSRAPDGSFLMHVRNARAAGKLKRASMFRVYTDAAWDNAMLPREI